MPAEVMVELLGPVQLLVDGVPADVGGTRPRTLLALLALRAGTPVSVEDLTAAVWGDAAPPSAAATLRAYVSRMRKLVGDALRREPAGYVLQAQVDAARFRDLAARATAGRAGAVPDAEAHDGASAAALEEALALWRGTPLTGTARSDLLAREVQGLVDAHIEVQRVWACSLAAAGRHDEAIGQLRTLVAAHPDRELIAGDLMVALYRVGRQQEALEVFRGIRSALQEGAGLEPGPDLRDLHQRILAHDPALLRAGMSSGAAGADRGAAPAAGAAAPPAAVEVPAAAPSAPAVTTNLPLPLTSFVGRTAELAVLGGLVDDHRLLTLTGPGGTGKTRLALEACRRRDDADGPWLVELAAVEDPAFVPTVIAEALVIGVQDGRSATEVLAAALSRRSTVLLLDNCEHVVDGVARIVELLLSRCPDVRIVATSREPLGVPGERTFGVSTLPVVERSPELVAANGDAMRLFLDRARNVVPDLDPDAATMELIRRICQDLDGLPLAIELAAAELRALSPRELEQQLSDRFAVLTGGPRTAQPRQRTLQTTVAWSVDLLDPAQRDLFAKLSVFVGGFTLEAVRAVCGPQAASLLPDLVERSLVEVDTSREPRRYRLLETLRQYGAAMLDETTTWRLHDRHARWCADLVRLAGEHLHAHEGPTWERILDREIGNIRVGLRTAMTDGEWQTALAMADALWWYWFRRARLEEGRRWLAEITAADHRRDGLLADVHYGLAFLAFFAGDPVVEELNDTAIDIAREAGDRAVLARLLTSKAYRWSLFGRLSEALPIAAEGLAVLPPDAPAWLRSECLFSTGQVARAQGDHALAQQRLQEALALAEGCGHRWLNTVALWVLAEHALDVDAPREAARLLARALQLARDDGDRAAVLGSLRSLAGVAARVGQPTDGARLLGMVRGLSRRIGMDVDLMERLDADRTVEVLQTALRPEAFSAAVADGEGQAIGAALGLAGRILAAAADV